MSTPQNPSYAPPTPDKITVAAFMPNVGGATLTDSLCSKLKDCGFNSALIETTEANVSSSLTNCAKYGIKPFLRSNDLNETSSKWFTFARNYKDNPHLGGWFLSNGVMPSQAEKSSALENALVTDGKKTRRRL